MEENQAVFRGTIPSLTDIVVHSLGLPNRSQYQQDGELEGFGVSVTTKGTKPFSVQCQSAMKGRKTRKRFGRHGDVNSRKVRDHAKETLAKVPLGAILPVDHTMTFADRYVAYQEQHLTRRTASPQRADANVWKNRIPNKVQAMAAENTHAVSPLSFWRSSRSRLSVPLPSRSTACEEECSILASVWLGQPRRIPRSPEARIAFVARPRSDKKGGVPDLELPAFLSFRSGGIVC
ncbi:hypothetical protein CLV78_101896 [Aliiruegeria haliotis]|uniref:Uncharacterized protein n=1 Tax=Aliiruegeria haliotis TaxID=1280846 RepID=A0A2T0S043_9RHOB|nr:hypothetical protein CLV78_101896 [Aliiruegeria haliotis]